MLYDNLSFTYTLKDINIGIPTCTSTCFSKTTKALPLFHPCGSEDRASVNQKQILTLGSIE